jgi:molybdopterin converting factor small subunit
MEGNRISGNLILLLNKRDIDTLAGEGTIVKEGDEIAVLPHVQGG